MMQNEQAASLSLPEELGLTTGEGDEDMGEE